MMLAPRYDGPVILTMDGSSTDQREPFTRQRRRMMTMLAALSDEQWTVPTRCDGWTAREVVAHLVTVNGFWRSSILAGLDGSPSRVLAGFDPAATPPMLVDWMSALGSSEVLDQFNTSSHALLDIIEALRDDEWATVAETPAGHVPIRLLVQHALWDAWVHERDISLPLEIASRVEHDEVTSCLRYAAAISPTLGLGLGQTPTTTLAVEATDPDVRFVIEVDGAVSVRDEPPADMPCLHGDALELTEALSLRVPLPSSTPPEWRQLLAGLATAFDSAPL